MAKKDYSDIVYVNIHNAPTYFVRIDPIVNGKKVFIDVSKWDGDVPGVMYEIYKQCGFMEKHLYNNVKQEIVNLRHKYCKPRKNENLFEGDIIGARMDSYNTYIYGNFRNLPAIKKVIFNDPATIVFWVDGTKTVVKCQYSDIFDPEKGLAMAISKKALGNQGNYCNEFKKWLPKDEEVTLSQAINNIGKSIVEAVNKRLNQVERGN